MGWDEVRQSGLMWRGGRVTEQICEKEMRIQKGGHHSDAHLFSFNQSPTDTQTRMHACLHACGYSCGGGSCQYFSAGKEAIFQL